MRSIPPARFANPVVFFANGLGDTILALPALRALTALFPDRLTLVCDHGVWPALLGELTFKRVVETRMRRNVPDWTREFSVADIIRDIGGCDLFISLVPWMSQSLRDLLQGLAPAASVGFFDDYATPVALDFTRHAADLTFDPVAQFNATLRLDDFVAPLAPDPRSRSIVDATLGLLPAGYRVLAVHADTGRPKMWPAERFVSALDRFLDRHSDFMVLLVGTTPQPLDTGTHAAQVVPCYGLPIGVSMGLVARANLFLGVDSCMLHVADLSRVPGVGLFGASNPVEYGFRFSPHSAIVTAESMLAIGVDQVLEALETVLAGSAPGGRVLGRQ
jgi:ADP-heptose:LPS heptosyltransferase